jgi:hypothetical protein
MITRITNHVQLALGRLLEQDKGKAGIANLASALVEPLQTLENTFMDLLTLRVLGAASGLQLDQLGDVVGIDRLGLGDAAYAQRISARILVNISNGDPETLIQIFKLLTQGSLVVYEEHFPAGYGVMSNGPIPADQRDLILALMEAATGGGIRMDTFGVFDNSAPFAMAGTIYPGGGFGSTLNPTAGGKLGQLYLRGSSQFAFAGIDTTTLGFGNTLDPVAGGRFISL